MTAPVTPPITAPFRVFSWAVASAGEHAVENASNPVAIQGLYVENCREFLKDFMAAPVGLRCKKWANNRHLFS